VEIEPPRRQGFFNKESRKTGMEVFSAFLLFEYSLALQIRLDTRTKENVAQRRWKLASHEVAG